MSCLTPTRWRAHFLSFGGAAALALLALTVGPSPARARIWVSVGVPCCGGYWDSGPYWGYSPPYAYYPPPAYYPAPAYYSPPPGYYPPPPPSAAVPTGRMSPAAPNAAQAMPRITYTGKPAFTNSAGQTCREYKANAGGRDVFGTACQQADGRWRVVN